eukprot:scaffold129846_cov17-Tisochrysis_lutea.AAC.1
MLTYYVTGHDDKALATRENVESAIHLITSWEKAHKASGSFEVRLDCTFGETLASLLVREPFLNARGLLASVDFTIETQGIFLKALLMPLVQLADQVRSMKGAVS